MLMEHNMLMLEEIRNTITILTSWESNNVQCTITISHAPNPPLLSTPSYYMHTFASCIQNQPEAKS
jgi:hypothetical protein